MKTAPMMIMILSTSSIMCVSLNSWVSIWVMLEMNTLCFCAILKTYESPMKNMMEASMKYFIIQSVSSAMLIIFVVTSKLPQKSVAFLGSASLLALMMKMASSPFHMWFVNITKQMKWKNATILMTWQKLAPVLLLMHQAKFMLFVYVVMSAAVGTISQMNKKATMEIMAFSSVFNMSWIMAATLTNTKVLALYLLLYWTTVLFMMYVIKTTKMKSLDSEMKEGHNKWMNFTILLNLAGIPPMAGFLSKWLVFSELANENNLLTPTVLLVMSSVNLYIYMRMMNHNTLAKTQYMQKSPSPNSWKPKMLMFMLILMPLPLTTL